MWANERRRNGEADDSLGAQGGGFDGEPGAAGETPEEPAESRASRSADFSGTPSWLMSGGFHTLLLIILSLIAATTIAPPAPAEFQALLEKPPEPVVIEKGIEEPTKVPNVFVDAPEVNIIPVAVEFDPIAKVLETPDESDAQTVNGNEGVGIVDLGSVGASDAIGVGGPPSGRFGPRGPGGRKLHATIWGSQPSVSAVDLGLEWLAKHQSPDGHWDAGAYGGERKDSHDAAVTGLALMAFLGAGFVEGRETRYADNVRRGLDWLASRQASDGSFSSNNYAHGMCAIAVAEAYGMTDKRKEMAQRAIDVLVKRQKALGGWDYGDKGDPGRNRSDTSITCWQVMALKSARIGGLAVPDGALGKVNGYFRAAGDVSNSDATGTVAYEIVDGKPSRGGLAVTAMTMLSCLFLDFKPDNRFVVAGAKILQENGPQIGASMNLYYTYYATMAMFQMGKEYFTVWNKGMCAPLVALQIRDKSDNHGSWAPEGDTYGKDGGRVYTTAMACLCLEVYSRYLPVYGKNQ